MLQEGRLEAPHGFVEATIAKVDAGSHFQETGRVGVGFQGFLDTGEATFEARKTMSSRPVLTARRDLDKGGQGEQGDAADRWRHGVFSPRAGGQYRISSGFLTLSPPSPGSSCDRHNSPRSEAAQHPGQG